MMPSNFCDALLQGMKLGALFDQRPAIKDGLNGYQDIVVRHKTMPIRLADAV